MRWDAVADVAIVGSGAGGLASAIVAADAGLTVFVADASGERLRHGSRLPAAAPSRRAGLLGRAGLDQLDAETNGYLDSLSWDIRPLMTPAAGGALLRRVVVDRPRVQSGRRGRATVETFAGSRLRDWAGQCLASPYGILYSRISDRTMTTTRTQTGSEIEAATIGVYEPDPGTAGPALADWLLLQASDRNIELHEASPLRRLIFEEGQVTGAVVDTPQGTCAVRALHGVAIATGGYPPLRTDTLPADTTVEVCVVSQAASRFARIELLTRRSAAKPSTRAWPLMVRALHAIL